MTTITIDVPDDLYELSSTVFEVRERLRTINVGFTVGPFIPERPQEVESD